MYNLISSQIQTFRKQFHHGRYHNTSGIGDYELLVTWWNMHFNVCIDLMV
jgi:hypothetical protein